MHAETPPRVQVVGDDADLLQYNGTAWERVVPGSTYRPLAMKALDGADRRWVLLETSVGSLQKSYAAMLKANLAVVHKGKNLPIDKTGRYEFVYLVGPSVKQGAFVYLEDRPTAAGLIVGPFKVPWK